MDIRINRETISRMFEICERHKNGIHVRSEIPKLKQSRNYSLGNDLWGLIHDMYGKEMVYETLGNLKQFPEVLNSALRGIGREDLVIL